MPFFCGGLLILFLLSPFLLCLDKNLIFFFLRDLDAILDVMALLATTEAILVGEILLLYEGHTISVTIVVVLVPPDVADGCISLENMQGTLQSLRIVALSQVWV